MCRNNGKVNIALFAAAVLLCLTLFTTHLTSGLYARYTTTASGSDSARVAKFEVKYTMPNNVVFDLAPSGTQSQSIEIEFTNNSEVTVRFGIKITTSVPLPNKLVLKVSDEKYVTADGSKMEYIIENVWSASPLSGEETFTLTIDASSVSDAFSGDVSISAVAEQID